MRLILVLSLLLAGAQDKDKKKKGDPATTKEAMQRIQLLIGEWRCTGDSDEGKRDAWTEKVSWKFKIDKDDHSIEAAFTDDRYFKSGLLTYDLARKTYKFAVTPTSGDKKSYEGKLIDKELALEYGDPNDKEKKQERLVFNLLRDNRYLVALERRAGTAKEWTGICRIACTKEGVPFVKGGGGPVCIITGGTAVSKQEYKGKTYYFC